MAHHGIVRVATTILEAGCVGCVIGFDFGEHPAVIRQVLAAWLACSGSKPVVYAVELARPTAIERFVGGASSDDRAVR